MPSPTHKRHHCLPFAKKKKRRLRFAKKKRRIHFFSTSLPTVFSAAPSSINNFCRNTYTFLQQLLRCYNNNCGPVAYAFSIQDQEQRRTIWEMQGPPSRPRWCYLALMSWQKIPSKHELHSLLHHPLIFAATYKYPQGFASPWKSTYYGVSAAVFTYKTQGFALPLKPFKGFAFPFSKLHTLLTRQHRFKLLKRCFTFSLFHMEEIDLYITFNFFYCSTMLLYSLISHGGERLSVG